MTRVKWETKKNSEAVETKSGRKLYRLVSDPHPMHLEGHHYTLSQIRRCWQDRIFLEGTIFREGNTLWELTPTGLKVIQHGLERGVNQKLRQHKLSPEEVMLIRYRHQENHERIADLAREYQVSPQHISNMVNGRRR